MQGTASYDADERPSLDGTLVAEVLAAVGRPPGTRCSDLGGGWRLNVGIGDPPDLVVRVHRRSTPRERVRAEQTVRGHLADHGVPAVRALPFPGGDTVGVLGSGPVLEVEPFVPGGVRMDSAETLTAGFALLAQVHDLLRDPGLPAPARVVGHANHVEAADALPATVAGAGRVRSWGDPALGRYADRVVAHVTAVRRVEDRLAPLPAPQLVHGDWWDDNVLFDELSRPVAVLDLGFMAARSRVDDLALPVWFFLLREGADLDRDVDAVAAWVAAYDAAATQPLTSAERLRLPLVVARQPAWSVGRWLRVLPEPQAGRHAREAAAELPVAERVLRDHERWWRRLGVDPG